MDGRTLVVVMLLRASEKRFSDVLGLSRICVTRRSRVSIAKLYLGGSVGGKGGGDKFGSDL